MKDLNAESKKNFPVFKLLICAGINTFLFLFLLPIAAASHATNIPSILIGFIYFALCMLNTSRAKNIFELIFLVIMSLILTFLFYRYLGKLIIIDRYIALVNHPDPDERHMHLTDNLDVNMNTLGFIFASGLAGIFRLCTIVIKSDELSIEMKKLNNESNTDNDPNQ